MLLETNILLLYLKQIILCFFALNANYCTLATIFTLIWKSAVTHFSFIRSFRPFKRGLAGLLALSALSLPAQAEESFTQAQKKEIISVVREALKTDPSILTEAFAAIKEKADKEKTASTSLALLTHQAALNGLPTDGIAGNPNGRLTVVEFYDPRCPYCRKMLPDLETFLKEDKDVRFVAKVIPVLGPASILEARAIIAAAKQKGYLKLQKALMTDASSPSLDRIKLLAQQQQLNVRQLLEDMNTPETTQAIKANMQVAQDLNLEGTPAFIFGKDTIIPGKVSLAQLKKIADEVKNKN